MAEVVEAHKGMRRFVTVEALRITIGRPPVWLFVFALQFLLALAPALLYYDWISGAMSHRYEPGSLFANLSSTFRFDYRREIDAYQNASGTMGALLAFFAMCVGCFCAGGWLQIFLERTRGESLRRFFLGGARYFWRFFRLLLLSLASLAIAGWIVYGWPWNTIVLSWLHDVPTTDYARLETLGSERTVVMLGMVQAGLFALATGTIMTWGTYTRTRLALHDTNSALWAGLCTWYTLLRHPVKLIGPIFYLFLLEIALVLGLGVVARSIEADLVRRPEAVGIVTLFATAQFVLLWRVMLRGAGYHAAISVSRQVVRPIARPDPWKHSVGGPGGPRYPIGDDEYSVSL